MSRRPSSISPSHGNYYDDVTDEHACQVKSECAEDESLMPVGQEESEDQNQGSEDRREGQDQGDDDDDDHEDQDAEEEARNPRGARDPGQPSQQEREDHERTHIPFRPWCEACIRGKSKRRPSRTIAGEHADRQGCRLRMDYAHLTEDVETGEGEG